MRTLLFVALVLSWIGSVSPTRADQPASPSPGDSKDNGSSHRFGDKLQILIDRSEVDLEHHRLQIRLNRPAARIELKVFDESHAPLAEKTLELKESSAGQPILLTWTPSSDEPVARIEIYAYDTDDNWVAVAIVPWSVNIPHQEVLFETDKADIRKSEEPKLDESLHRIQSAVSSHGDLGRIQLFIAGHTDTVGTAAYNLALSRRRARAIAVWFQSHGLGIPIAYEGFGETAPLVETKDEVDEPRNRRVDYILSVETPSTKKGRAPSWRYLKQD